MADPMKKVRKAAKKLAKKKALRRRVRNLDRMIHNGRPRFMKRSTFRRIEKAADARRDAVRNSARWKRY